MVSNHIAKGVFYVVCQWRQTVSDSVICLAEICG